MKFKYSFTLIKRASLTVEKYAARRLAEYDLSPSQAKVMRALSLVPDRTVRVVDLQEFFFMTHPTVIGILKNLMKKGLVIRTEDPANHRIHYVSLTDKGHALTRDLERVVGTIEQDTTKNLTRKERTALIRLLRKMQEPQLTEMEINYFGMNRKHDS